MFKRFSADKLQFIYLSALTLCLVVGLFLVGNSGRTTESVVLDGNNQVALQEAAIVEADQSVLAAETTNTPQPAQKAPAAGQTTPKKQTTTADKAASAPQSPESAAPSVTPSGPSMAEATAAEPVQKFTAYLSINSNYKGAVGVEAGSNQCDVLAQALKDGVIQSLDMRYNKDFKTQGIYIIDGQGDSKIINWVYTVNDNQVPFGCSKAYVQNNDKVNWQYVGG